MALVLADRVRETTTVVGTGTATLLGAIASYQSFAAIGNANTTYYTIVNQSANEWEVGIGTYTASGTLLSRDTVLSSSNSGSLVNFSAGTKDVWGDYPAGKAVTTDTLAYPPAIGSTTPAAGTFTTLTATGQTSLGGVAGSESLRVVTPSSAPNAYVKVFGSPFGFGYITTDGSAASSGLLLSSKGGASASIYTNNFSQEQLRVPHTASAVNYVQVTGAATGSFASISAQGSDAITGLGISSKGAARINFFNNNSANRQVSIGGNGAAAVNFIGLDGSVAGNGVQFSAQGSDTNISQVFQSKGTGAIDLAAGSSGVNISNGGTITALTRTNGGSGYTSAPSVVIAAPTTAGGVQATATATISTTGTPTIVSGGTGYTVGNVLTIVGGTPVSFAATMTVTAVSGGVITAASYTNFAQYTVAPTGTISVTGGTGAGATFNISFGVTAAFTITNAGSGYVEQPTVTFSGGGGSGAAAYATVGSGTVVRSLGGLSDLTVDTTPILHLRAKNTSGGNPTNATAAFGLIPPQSNFGAPILGTISSPYFVWGGTGTSFFMSAATSPQTTGNTGTSQFAIAHTTSAVNYVQVTGAVSGGQPTISAQGSDTNVTLRLSGKGSGVVDFASNGNPYALQVVGTASGANYNSWRATSGAGGSGASSTPVMSTWGIDTNIALALQSKGTGAIDLAAGSSGVNISNGGTVTAITGITGGSYTTVPTITISAPTTAGGVQATATVGMASLSTSLAGGGTGYSVNDVLTFVGGTASVPINVTVNTVSAGVILTYTVNNGGTYTVLPTNPISVTGGTGTGATFNVPTWQVRTTAYTITNAGSGYVEQPTITFSSGSATAYATVGSGTTIKSLHPDFFIAGPASSTNIFRFGSVGNAVNNLFTYNNTTGASPVLRSIGSDTNVGVDISSQGTGNIRFLTNAVNQEQLRVAHTASAVNYVQVTGAATGGAPLMSVQGSDTNIAFNFTTKGNSAFNFTTNNGSQRQFRVTHTTSAVNFGYVTGSAAGGAVTFGVDALSSDTNIDLALAPKGTGNVRFGTYTGTALSIAGYIEIKDSGGTIRRLAVVA